MDTGVPKNDAGLFIENLEDPVGATSTSIAVAVGQAINAATSAKLIEMGHKPMIMVSPNTTEKERANKINDRNYRELWERLRNRSHDQIQ